MIISFSFSKRSRIRKLEEEIFSECKHPLGVVNVVFEETYKKLMTIKLKCLFLKMLTADLSMKRTQTERALFLTMSSEVDNKEY